MDLPGLAIHDFYFNKSRKKLFVHDTFGPKVEMPVGLYFRDFAHMPDLEKKALNLCQGKVLDIGAGAGSHALELQKRELETFALEISPAACEVMRERGIEKVICEDVFKFKEQKFDTLLLLMNGIGLCGSLEGLYAFLKHAKTLMNPGAKMIFDSCDVSYMYEDTDLPSHYWGEVQCRYEYAGKFTEWFNWLYVDQHALSKVAHEGGWQFNVLAEDQNSQFLAELTLL